MNDSETAALTELIRGIRETYKTTIILIEHDMHLCDDSLRPPDCRQLRRKTGRRRSRRSTE